MQAVEGDPGAGAAGPCASCGAVPFGEHPTCQSMWDDLLARSFSELAYARFHRLIVDLYSLQHPDAFCRSAKSYAAHLTGLCVVREHGADARINATVQRWLSNPPPSLVKAPVPRARGALTLVHLLQGRDAPDVARRVGEWAESVWDAYEAVHETAREWIRDASSRR